MLSLYSEDDILELSKEDDTLYLFVQIPWDDCPSSWGWVDINVMTLLNADFATGIKIIMEKKNFLHFSTFHNMVELDQSCFQYFPQYG